MEIKKRRYGGIPLDTKKQIRENRKNITTQKNDSDAIVRSKNDKKVTYFIEDIFSCSLYQIAETKIAHTKVKPFKFADAFTTNKIWQGGLYYTKGNRIDIVDNKSLKECLVVIHECSSHYKKFDGFEFPAGYVPNSSKTSIYLFKNGNLYLMEKDVHPDVAQDSYRLLDEICTIPSHIEVFSETIKQENHQSKSTCLDFVVEDDLGYFCRYDDLIGSPESSKEESGPVLVKRKTPPINTGNK